MKLAETLGSGQGRNYTPINRCVAFSEGPCRELDVHSGRASIPIQGVLRSPCAGFASYPFVNLPTGTTLRYKPFLSVKFSEIRLYFFDGLAYNKASDNLKIYGGMRQCWNLDMIHNY